MAAAGLARAVWASLLLRPGPALVLTPPGSQNDVSWLPDLAGEGEGSRDGAGTEVQASKVDLHMPERGLRTPLSWNKFPLWINDRRLVARFQRVYHGVHIFTVGVYVNRRCDVWGKTWDASTYPELLERAVGNTTLRYEIVSKYLTRKMWAQDLIGREIVEHYDGPKSEKNSLARMHERLTYKGPIFHTGAVLDFVLQDKEVWYLFNEQFVGRVGNRESSKAMLGTWVDDRSAEVFRQPLFHSLERGVTGRSLEMTARTGEENLPTGGVVLLVAVSAIVAFASASCCLCCYWKLKKTAEEGSFHADYVESAA